jgi:hypothetical protein
MLRLSRMGPFSKAKKAAQTIGRLVSKQSSPEICSNPAILSFVAHHRRGVPSGKDRISVLDGPAKKLANGGGQVPCGTGAKPGSPERYFLHSDKASAKMRHSHGNVRRKSDCEVDGGFGRAYTKLSF